MRRLQIILPLALAGAAIAADSSVPVPRERPVEPASSSSIEPADVPLPRERPAPSSSEPASLPQASASAASASAEPPPLSSAPSPAASSEAPAAPGSPAAVIAPKIYQTACPAVMSGEVTAKTLPPIHEGQCGLQSPLSIEAVRANGRSIELATPVTTDCGMATALPGWIAAVDAFALAREKTTIETINLGTGYQCRNVDHAATGSLSFHAFGDAVDLIGFRLSDGRTISIAPGFNGTPEQGHNILHFARDAACGRFMTVLSPDADAFHQDNMHLDLACHGKQCKTSLCE